MKISTFLILSALFWLIEKLVYVLLGIPYFIFYQWIIFSLIALPATRGFVSAALTAALIADIFSGFTFGLGFISILAVFGLILIIKKLINIDRKPLYFFLSSLLFTAVFYLLLGYLAGANSVFGRLPMIIYCWIVSSVVIILFTKLAKIKFPWPGFTR
ncbi:MAG: hypothetical protein CEN90_41 [Parcubacteria group bacterium Licking1014_17]|nr:MAG: hypothetical protein CEN90_41 [Parcubacteria group bacterium Licking1014_17]